nr:hypothetical protein [Nanoarchaeum sp.]
MKIINKLLNIYNQDGKTFFYHLTSVGMSTIAGAVTAGCLENAGYSPAFNSSITTGVAATSYWGPFIGLLVRNEKSEMKDKTGRYNRKKVISKTAQYASFVGVGEFIYTAVRGIMQYQLQKELDAPTASILTDLACATVYGILVPPVRYALRDIGGEKKLEQIVEHNQESEIPMTGVEH